jgi:hypothetical protein
MIQFLLRERSSRCFIGFSSSDVHPTLFPTTELICALFVYGELVLPFPLSKLAHGSLVAYFFSGLLVLILSELENEAVLAGIQLLSLSLG